jgi:preprotein translocase SecE subunit
VAKNRQRAKQRQAQRRAQRLGEGGSRTPGAPRGEREDGEVAGAPEQGGDGASAPAGFEADRGGTVPAEVGVEAGADLAASAPPEDAGRSDTVVETAPPPLAADPEDDPKAAASRGRPPEGDSSGEAEEAPLGHDRNRVVAFLIAVWAELKRVQWPNRQHVTTLTGVVIGFVIIMGAYLGALDAVFARLIQAII